MPRIQITRSVKIALISLRVYLIVLLLLIIFKFILLFTHGSGKQKESPVKPSTSLTVHDSRGSRAG